jgi:enoyl-[acyl-carrier protein] reductase I
MGLLDGKKGLVLNIANDRSIATYIATHAINQGATCGFGFLPMDNLEKSQRRVRKAMEENGFGDAFLHPCDVGSDESIASFFAAVAEKFGTIDFLVHSLAFANRDYLKKDAGVFTSTPRDVFKQALDISAYSLIALTRAAVPLMPNGGSVIAMTYLGAEKVIPGYNVMGVAKSALEVLAAEQAVGMDEVGVGAVEQLDSSADVELMVGQVNQALEVEIDLVDDRSIVANVEHPAEV